MADSATTSPNRQLTPLWALGLSVQACIWASSYPAIDRIVTPPDGTQGLTILQLAFWRAAIAVVVFIPLSVGSWRQGHRIPARGLAINLGLGAVLGIAITLWGWGVAYGSLVINGFLNALFPVMVTLLSIRFGDRVHPKAWAWIIVAIVGTLVMLVGQASGAAEPDAAGHRYGLLPYGAMLISLVVISLHT
ncbi:MAG: DMT family transporter, partial [bacterium]